MTDKPEQPPLDARGESDDDLKTCGFVSEYRVLKMDCPSEENMIRMALDGIEPRVLLAFDTPNRKVRVFHGDNATTFEERMNSLGWAPVW